MLLSHKNLFNFRATFSLVNKRTFARSQNSTDWKLALRQVTVYTNSRLALPPKLHRQASAIRGPGGTVSSHSEQGYALREKSSSTSQFMIQTDIRAHQCSLKTFTRHWMPWLCYLMKILLNAVIMSNFNYCHLIWLFCSKAANSTGNRMHKRALRVLYQNFEFSFEELPSRHDDVTINVKAYRNCH